MSTRCSDPGQFGQLDGVARGERHRLLDQDVLAGRQRLAGDLEMRLGDGGDDDAVERCVFEQIVEPGRGPDVRELLADRSSDGRADIADPAQLRPWQGGERANPVAAPASGPDYADGRHENPCSFDSRARVFSQARSGKRMGLGIA